jgi:hypothetical protein
MFPSFSRELKAYFTRFIDTWVHFACVFLRFCLHRGQRKGLLLAWGWHLPTLSKQKLYELAQLELPQQLTKSQKT